MSDQGQTYLPHNCHAWNTIHYCSQPDARYEKCGYCGQILYFRYRSTWKQILSVFGIRPYGLEEGSL